MFPYLLRNLVTDRPNQIRVTDISYTPMSRGFAYLVAVMGSDSRKVLSQRISKTLKTRCCVEALEEGTATCGCPEVFNTDKGGQFASADFTDVLKANNVPTGIDSKGR